MPISANKACAWACAALLSASATVVSAQTAAASNPAAASGAVSDAAVRFNSGDTAWMLISIVLVLLMTIPGLMLFYSGMLRTKNALSVVAHTFAATTVITLLWVAIGYSVAFTNGTP